MCCKIFSCRCFHSRTMTLIVLWYSWLSYIFGLTRASITRPWNEPTDSTDLQNIFRILHCYFASGSILLGLIPSLFGLYGVFTNKSAYMKFYINGMLGTIICLNLVGVFLLKLTICYEKPIFPVFIMFHASMYLYTWPISLYTSTFYPSEVESNILLWSILIFSLEIAVRSRFINTVLNYDLEMTTEKRKGVLLYFDAENRTAQLVVPQQE